MSDNEKTELKEFIKDSKELIEKDDLHGRYCILIYTYSSGLSLSKKVKYIYKNIVDFENKVEKDIENIDESIGIFFELWLFD